MKCILRKSKNAESFPKILKIGIFLFLKSFFTKKMQHCNECIKKNKEISKERKRLEIFLGRTMKSCHHIELYLKLLSYIPYRLDIQLPQTYTTECQNNKKQSSISCSNKDLYCITRTILLLELFYYWNYRLYIGNLSFIKGSSNLNMSSGNSQSEINPQNNTDLVGTSFK